MFIYWIALIFTIPTISPPKGLKLHVDTDVPCVTLYWVDCWDPDRYEIWRGASPTNLTYYDEVPGPLGTGSVVTYTDNNITVGETYWYRVRTYDPYWKAYSEFTYGVRATCVPETAYKPIWGIVNVYPDPYGSWTEPYSTIWRRDLHYLKFLGVTYSRPNCAPGPSSKDGDGHPVPVSFVSSSNYDDIDFSAWDSVIYWLRYHGIKGGGVAGTAYFGPPVPAWARPPGSNNNYPPDSAHWTEFGRYAQNVVLHLRNTWGCDSPICEIWNEPYGNFMGTFEKFAEYVKLIYDSVKSVLPGARIMAPTIRARPRAWKYASHFISWKDTIILNSEDTILKGFDAVIGCSVKTNIKYTREHRGAWWLGHLFRLTDGKVDIVSINYFLMETRGDSLELRQQVLDTVKAYLGNVPIWMPEEGWCWSRDVMDTNPEIEQWRTAYWCSTFCEALKAIPLVQEMNWFTLAFQPESTQSGERKAWGLLDQNRKPYSAYWMYMRQIKRTRPRGEVIRIKNFYDE